MKIVAFLLLSSLTLNNVLLNAQRSDSLRSAIQALLSQKKAKVGVAIMGEKKQDSISINGADHFPMQSVFKLPIALAVLSEVDKGRFSLTQKIKVAKSDLLPNLYSPIREKYPNGGDLDLAEILRYTVAESDNVGCDLLLRMLGGPQKVEQYFMNHNFKQIKIRHNEETMQANWDLQFDNWTTPIASNEILAAFYPNDPKLLSRSSYDFIWGVLKSTKTGEHRLRGQLPSGTVLAHKTGSSGANKDGLTAAVNDIGVLFLPNGRLVFISVFVTDSRESAEENERIIAEIGKATWDFFKDRK